MDVQEINQKLLRRMRLCVVFCLLWIDTDAVFLDVRATGGLIVKPSRGSRLQRYYEEVFPWRAFRHSC